MTLRGILRRLLGRSAAERVTLVPSSPWWGEHRSRVHYGAQFARGKRVLDVATGTGYAVPLLRDAGASSVVGVDRSQEPMRERQARSRAGESFVSGDAVCLPFKSGAFDLIISFETLEHLEDDKGFVSEIARCLAADGLIVLSTPRTDDPDRVPANPFHVREFDQARLRGLLSESFSDVRIVGQKTDPRWGTCPFWEADLASVPLWRRLRLMMWTAAHYLIPYPIKDRWSRLLHNRSFYPGEYDFLFEERFQDSGHVLVAVCSR